MRGVDRAFVVRRQGCVGRWDRMLCFGESHVSVGGSRRVGRGLSYKQFVNCVTRARRLLYRPIRRLKSGVGRRFGLLLGGVQSPPLPPFLPPPFLLPHHPVPLREMIEKRMTKASSTQPLPSTLSRPPSRLQPQD